MFAGLRICVVGAGSVGCYVGGRLRASSCAVTLVGREQRGEELRKHGLTVTSLHGATARLLPEEITFSTDLAAAAEAQLVIVAVKSRDTESVGQALARVLPESATVLSLQNGVRNGEQLAAALPGRVVLPG